MDDLKKNEIYEAAMTDFTSEGAGRVPDKGPRRVRAARPARRDLARAHRKGHKDRCVRQGGGAPHHLAERVEPDCPNFGRCGGCNLMHMSYAASCR